MAPHDLSQADRERQLDEAIAEYLEAVDAGRRPRPEDWLTRFPDLAPELARFFGDQAQVHGLLATVGTPLPPGEEATLVANRHPPSIAGLTRFGDYELEHEIARGGMGVVYRARQLSLNRTVALKMILAGRLASAADVQRFRSEAEAAANLEHPHIVTIYEIGERDGYHFFTMKFIDGGNLAQHADRFRDDIPAAARLLATVARAVHHAHQRGLLHRDLKPANILVDDQGQPHLTDFGLARRLNTDTGQTRSGTAVGTPSYMAPEQAFGPAHAITTAADVFSLGAILYELLVGHPPFRAHYALETLRNLLEREPARPRALNPCVSRDLETICLKCLNKDPARRYGSAAELADDLERWLRGEPIRGRRAGPGERLWHWCRRRPLIAALSAALAASLVVGTSLITWQWLRAEANFSHAEELRIRAEEQRQRTDAERLRADEGFRQAHSAVNDFCTRVSEGTMRDVAGLQPVRQELLKAALAYYERFLKERGHDPALRLEMADTHFRIATITSLLGPKPDALAAYRRALALYEDLLKQDPGSAVLRTALAESHARIGMLHAEMGAPDAALDSYRLAMELYEKLLSQQPGNPALQNGAAAVLNNTGTLHRWAGRTREARDCLDRARTLQEELVRGQPASPEFRASLARTYCNLAGLHADQAQRGEARGLYRQARDLQEQLVEEEPVNLRYQQDLAATCRMLAGELNTAGQWDEALRTVDRGQELLTRLVRAEPRMPGLKSDLASGCRQAGHIYRDSGNLDKALAQYDKALALMEELARDHPEVPNFRNDLAKCHFDRSGILRRQNKHQEMLQALQAAAELRRKLVRDHPEHVGYHSDLGLTLGNIAAHLANTGRHAEALLAIREAVEQHRAAFERAPPVAHYRRFLSGACGALTLIATDTGHVEEALAAARERQKLWPGNAAELYLVAADVARAAILRPVTGKADGVKLADLAVAVLREAVAAGFRDATRLQTDAAFAGVRSRADFQEILTALAASHDGDG
jgi:serine/threonine protein kinase/tetratricopeptide (TPR) repeat protein